MVEKQRWKPQFTFDGVDITAWSGKELSSEELVVAWGALSQYLSPNPVATRGSWCTDNVLAVFTEVLKATAKAHRTFPFITPIHFFDSLLKPVALLKPVNRPFVLAFLLHFDIEQKDYYGRTALHFAAAGENLEMVRLLGERGADVHAVCIGNRTPLQYAMDVVSTSSEGYVAKLASILVEFGAKLDVRTAYPFGPWQELGDMPIHRVMRQASYWKKPPFGLEIVGQRRASYVSALMVLGGHGAINALNGEGDAVLHMAVRLRLLETFESTLFRLSMWRPDVDVRNSARQTPLHVACALCDVVAIEILLAHGADVNALDGDGATALHLAAAGGHLDVVRALIAHSSADVDLVDGDGATALHLAAAGGHLDVHRLLDSLRDDQAAEVLYALHRP